MQNELNLDEHQLRCKFIPFSFLLAFQLICNGTHIASRSFLAEKLRLNGSGESDFPFAFPPNSQVYFYFPAENKRIHLKLKAKKKEKQKQVNSESEFVFEGNEMPSRRVGRLRRLSSNFLRPCPSTLVPESICCGRNVNHRINQ